MQAELAAFGADALLVAAGFGVLLSVGLAPRGPFRVLAAVGLAYLVGAAFVPLVLTALLVVGVPFRLATFFFVVGACVVVGAWRFGGASSSRSHPDRRRNSWRLWTPDSWALAIFIVIFAVFAVFGLVNALNVPVTEWDAWTIWGRKAQILTLHETLPSHFFANPAYEFSHLDYPLQLPIWEAIHYRAAGMFDTEDLLGHVWLLLVAFIWGASYLLHVHRRVSPLVWAPLLLLVGTAPAVWQQASGNADLPLAIFCCIGLICLGFWITDSDNRFLAIATIMLAATANTKNEGTAIAVVVLLVAGVIVVARRLKMRAFLIATAGVFLGGILPWRIWLALQGIEGDMPVGKGLNPAYLVDRIGRVGPSIDALGTQLADQSRWAYLVPLGALMVVVAIVSGLGRRVATFYLAVFALIWGVFVWSYWISPYDLNWHLETSAPRIVTVLQFVCVAAILHLAGLFAAAFRRSAADPSAM